MTDEELGIMMKQSGGPIIRMNPTEQTSKADIDGENDSEENVIRSLWRRLVDYILYGNDQHKHHRRPEKKHGSSTVRGPHAYNLYDRKPGFQNDYGSSIAVDEHEYGPLRYTGVGVYFVNLTAVSSWFG